MSNIEDEFGFPEKSVKDGNFTNFLTGKKALLCSDFEGYISIGMKSKIINHIMNDSKKNCIIYNGDIADYMYDTPFTKDDINQTERFCFLELVQMVNDNPNNIVATIGNRDLNKLTVFHLIQHENFSVPNGEGRWWAQRDNNWKGEDTNHQTIIDIAKGLYETDKNTKKGGIKWLVKDLRNFWPYWNEKNKDISEWIGWESVLREYYVEKKDVTNYNEKTINLSLYDRFRTIFGQDPLVGFMSAQNTLYGIPIELGLKDKVIELITLESEEAKKNSEKRNDNKRLTDLRNEMAAIVFTVYARILDPELAKPENKKWKYDGCLYTYLMNNPLVGYAQKINPDELYLFSHGGVHSSFNKEDLLSSLTTIFNNNTTSFINADFFINNHEQKIKEVFQKHYKKYPTDNEIAQGKKAQQYGGQIDGLDDIVDFNMSVRRNIELFYDYFSGSFIKYHEKDDLETTPTLPNFILTALACPIGNNQNIKNLKEIERLDHLLQLESPIMSGYSNIASDKNQLFNKTSSNNNKYGFNNSSLNQPKERQIYNIFGHSPNGFGYTFGQSPNGQIYVCSDFTRSFLKDAKEVDKENFDSNNLILYLDFDKGRFSLDGGIFVHKNSLVKNPGEILLDDELKKYFDGLPNTFPLAFYDYRVNFNELLQKTNAKESYHGSGQIYIKEINNRINVDIYTVKGEGGGFNKYLKLSTIDRRLNNLQISSVGGYRKRTTKTKSNKMKGKNKGKINRQSKLQHKHRKQNVTRKRNRNRKSKQFNVKLKITRKINQK